jgi:hypothetical protein
MQEQLLRIQASLEEAGAPREILEHLRPYTLENVSYLYTGEGPKEMANGSGGQAPDGSEAVVVTDLMVATSAPIGEIVANNRHDDQAPEVLAQWRSKMYPRKPGDSLSIEREEVQQISDTMFVVRHYSGVSDLGVFDGELTEVTLRTQIGMVAPHSYPGRKEFAYDQYYQTKDGSWQRLNARTSGSHLLNGVGQLCSFSLGKIRGAAVAEGGRLAEDDTNIQMVRDGLHNTAREENAFDRAARIAERNPIVIGSARSAMNLLAEKCISSLAKASESRSALSMFMDGVLKHPDKVMLSGKTLDGLDPNLRFGLAQILVREGVPAFQRWFAQNLQGEHNKSAAALTERIVSLNLRHFAEFSVRDDNEGFRPLDVAALDDDVSSYLRGSRMDDLRYPLSQTIILGLKVATFNVFVEDFLAGRTA